MSRVTDCIITFSLCGDDERDDIITKINSFFDVHMFSRLDPDAIGGNKYFQANITLAAINYLDLGKFIQHLREMKIPKFIRLQFIFQEEDDEGFRTVHIQDGLG